MRCQECGLKNPSGARFCEECGARLEPTCATCGAVVSVDGKFCGRCGQPLTAAPPRPAAGRAPDTYTPGHLARRILSSRQAIEGERKQVTVLFADLKGSMELLADRDPEEARKLLDPVLERMMEAVHRYEGTVNQVMGDGIMAVFGAPLACEDHAVRACYAALDMQREMVRHAEALAVDQGVDARIRVGLNSGEVVVRSIGNDLHMDYTAIGETTHLAGRMEQMAAPGSTLTTGRTARLAQGYVELMSLGPRPVKGLGAPVDVYAVTGLGPVRTSLQAAMGRGLTRFVGRAAEVDQLARALERVRSGRVQVLGVVGQPGVGKSRLVHEFTGSERMQGWLVLQTGAASYGKATVYRPVIDLLRTYFGVHPGDDQQDIREKVMTKTLALDKGLRPALPALLFLLDVPVEDAEWRAMEPRQRQRETMGAIKGLFVRESQVRPLCLVFEDLHWVDFETLALLDDLIKSLEAASVLVVVNFRPEFQHDWAKEAHYVQLRLDPLPPANAEELLSLLLGGHASLTQAKRLLVEQTQGNPFFLEESVRTLVEHGALVGERGAYQASRAVETIQVPGTVQAVLAARIDRLAPEDKRLLQSASVIGENIPLRLLQAVVDMPESELHERLDRLRAAELLHDVCLFPEPEYVFRHGLTRQVAYDSLLRERRRALHARIADAIERLHADPQPELLAHHFTQAELPEYAIPHWQLAGQRAIQRSANKEALFDLTQGLKLLQALPHTAKHTQTELELQMALAPLFMMIKGQTAPEVERAYTRAYDLCQELGDDPRLFSVLAGLWRFYLNRAQFQAARDLAERCFRLAENSKQPTLLHEAHVMLGSTLLYLGEFDSSRTHLEHGIASYSRDAGRSLAFSRGTDPGVVCLARASWVLWLLGYPDSAVLRSQEALALAQDLSHAFSLGFALEYSAALHRWRREPQLAQERAEALIALSKEHGFLQWLLGGGMIRRGWALAVQGRAEEGLAQLREGVATYGAYGLEAGLPLQLGMLAEAYARVGDFVEGLKTVDKALAAVRRTAEGLNEAELYQLKGELLQLLQHTVDHRGPLTDSVERALTAIGIAIRPSLQTDVETCFHQAIDSARRQRAKSLELRAVLSLSRLWHKQGKGDEAYRLLKEVYETFTEGFDTPDLRDAKALLNELA